MRKSLRLLRILCLDHTEQLAALYYLSAFAKVDVDTVSLKQIMEKTSPDTCYIGVGKFPTEADFQAHWFSKPYRYD